MAQDLICQRLAVGFGVAPAFAPFGQARKPQVVAVTGTCRIVAFPEARTFAEQDTAPRKLPPSTRGRCRVRVPPARPRNEDVHPFVTKVRIMAGAA